LFSYECLQDADGHGAIPAIRHSWVVNSGASCQVRGLAAGVTYRFITFTVNVHGILHSHVTIITIIIIVLKEVN